MDAAQQEIAALERLVGPQGSSPLFARLADRYLQAGRLQDALRVCDSGLAQFPYYATGHFVKGKTLLALEMTNEARRELEFVRDWLPTNPTIWAYLDSLPVDEDQLLTAEAEPSAAAPAAEAETFSAEPEAAPADNYFSALTDAAPPTAAIDTTGSAEAPPAETNVFGLPSEVPTQGFGGFGGFGSAPEAPAAEPESPADAFGGFSGFGETTEPTVEGTDTVAAMSDEPTSTFDETVASAMGDGAPGYVPSTVSGESFDVYAERLRLELGPTGIITLEQFLEGHGIVPSDSFDSGVTAETPASAAPESSFDMPAPSVTTEETPAAEAPASSDDAFGFGGFPSTVAEEGTPVPAAETEPTGGLDLSGFPTADESPAATGSPAPVAEGPGGFAGPSFEGPPADTSIEGLTAKLKSAKKITPVIDFSSKSSSESSESTMASSSFVTPTLAEIYAKQGWFDDAIKAYRTLAKTKPAEREKYEARISELEEEKKKQG